MKLITNLAGALHIHQMNLACKKRAIEDTLTHSSNLSVFGSSRVRELKSLPFGSRWMSGIGEV
jgi:hypothetical protein